MRWGVGGGPPPCLYYPQPCTTSMGADLVAHALEGEQAELVAGVLTLLTPSLGHLKWL